MSREVEILERYLRRQEEILQRQARALELLESTISRSHARKPVLVWDGQLTTPCQTERPNHEMPLGPFSSYDLSSGLWIPYDDDCLVAEELDMLNHALIRCPPVSMPPRDFEGQNETIIPDHAFDRLHLLFFFKATLMLFILNLGHEWIMALTIVFLLHALRLTDPVVWLFRHLQRRGRERPMQVVLEQLQLGEREERAQQALHSLMGQETQVQEGDAHDAAEEVSPPASRLWCLFYQTVVMFGLSLLPWLIMSTHAGEARQRAGAAYTPDQERLSRSIIKKTNLYDVLGVGKDASDDDVKKAYRKLALQMHPDKNKAPCAEEAFKKVSKAFQVLSDTDKRRRYDMTGSEDPQPEQAFTAANEAEAFQHLFQHVFGGGFGVPFGEVFVNGRRVNRGNFRRQDQPQQTRGLLNVLVPFLIMLFFSWINSGSSEPREPFSFRRTHDFPHERSTRFNRVSFFIPRNFDSRFPPKSTDLHDFEVAVELHFYNQHCQSEREFLRSKVLWSRSYGSTKDYNQWREKFDNVDKDNFYCQKFGDIKNHYPSVWKQWNRK
ncbi:MAG: hypothetical protein KVP17_002189 [Porospora cf. gigantea B]|uniref:uncharacterized protein n=2 Tax=Porospora cf. gigantea B TaxID=2853592 RepID=UPI003571F8D0|nr:MAG: hypothetical protein KVP17_002189 [Porospora cf. gigantea B]